MDVIVKKTGVIKGVAQSRKTTNKLVVFFITKHVKKYVHYGKNITKHFR